MTGRRTLLAVTAAIVTLAAAVSLSRRTSVEAPERRGTRQIGPQSWVVTRVDKEAYLSDLARVSRHIATKPTPGKDENSVTDLVIVALADDSPMVAAGFRQDDRILNINGTPIGTLGRAINLVHEIKASDKLTVQVQRGDRILEYRFDFE